MAVRRSAEKDDVTALQAQVRAAIQQVRTSTPHGPTCLDGKCACATCAVVVTEIHATIHEVHWPHCSCDWPQRVDARLAACVEAALVGESVRAFAFDAAETERRVIREAGLAAFLAAAAPKETHEHEL